MLLSGQRHPFQARWKVGVSKEGKLLALEADIYNNAGFSQDMSGAVMDRCLTHFDNSYECPNTYLRGYVCRTNTHSNTAYRGFGAPQGMYFSETIMYNISEGMGIDIDELRQRNLYKPGEHTPFFQKIDDDWHVPQLLHQLAKSSEYEKRKAAVAEFNTKNRWKKRGICLVPSKFGLSFATALHLNQGAAYIKIYHDGSVLLHHGGTEMGQGLYTKMCQIAAQELGTPLDAIYTQDSQTYQIANASPTAASSGSDLNGMAVKAACDQINERLKPYREQYGKDAPLKTLAHAAYLDRVNLAANGFWKMPKVGYKWGDTNWETVKPMYYYWTQGAATSEVEVDLLTGDHTVLRSDIMMVSHIFRHVKEHANTILRTSATRSTPPSTMVKSKAPSFKASASSPWRKPYGPAPANSLRAVLELTKSPGSAISRKSSMRACCATTMTANN
jgi:xanthine dehydrogenase/oxidase